MYDWIDALWGNACVINAEAKQDTACCISE